ncbi:hypothetical protein JTE90_013022 [Oedothorax gibbosus]|uniref:RRM domain-containing protein n=1 Tax=Oedothorax gibbosus TaxID=931172 RepID=A0AAV6UAQ5_9ARAC|nr:hypothetical protein JTE90_013022 [Oedothorax gibbosus]
MDSTPEVYVGNFPTSFTAEDLLYLFQDFEGIRIKSFKKNKDNKCFAFLVCRNECQVIDIVTIMHDIDVCKRRLVVKAKDKTLQKRLEESLQSSDGLKELTQNHSRPNAKNDSSNIEKKNSIDEIVEKFPSAVRFKNPRLETPSQEKVRSPATDVPRWKILSQFSHQDAKDCEVLNNDDKAKVKPNSNDGNSTQFDASNSQSFQDKRDVNKTQIPFHPKPNQNVSVTNAPNLGSPENNSAQSKELASPQSALQPQIGQEKFENRGRGQNSNRANRNDVPFNRSNSQFPNDNGTKHQSLQIGKKKFGNRGRGQNSYRANRNDVPFNHSNLQFPNDNSNKYQSPGDYSATAQHHKSTMDVSPSQAHMDHSSTVYPEQGNAFPYQVHNANHNPDAKTPRSMTRQNRGNMRNNPLNNSHSQKEFNDVLNSNLVPNQSMSTQDNFSVTNLPTTDISYETAPKRPYNVELTTPDNRDAKSYQRDISDTNSTGTTASENSFHRRVLLPTPETTPKGLIQRGQSLLQKQQLSNQGTGNKLRRKSSESAENGSRASSSLGSYDGEESKEKLFYLSVANFPFGTSRKDLRYLFEDFEPCNIIMLCNVPLWNRRPTEAIIGFKSEDQVTNAILNIDNTDYMGRVIIVTDAVDCSILPSLMEVNPKKN